jgi:hypothetical protein
MIDPLVSASVVDGVGIVAARCINVRSSLPTSGAAISAAFGSICVRFLSIAAAGSTMAASARFLGAGAAAPCSAPVAGVLGAEPLL